MPVDIAFISAFLNREGVEGPRQMVGYVPARPGNFTGRPGQDPERYTAIGASGVTIATGCDLGQTDAVTLREYGVSQELIQELSPYIGLKTSAAIRKLAAAPLRLTPASAEELDHAVHAGYLRRYVRPAYAHDAGISLDDLPPQAQAVIFSLCFQLGCGGVRRRAPLTWKLLCRQQWKNASFELITGFQNYALRRRIEDQLLKELG